MIPLFQLGEEKRGKAAKLKLCRTDEVAMTARSSLMIRSCFWLEKSDLLGHAEWGGIGSSSADILDTAKTWKIDLNRDGGVFVCVSVKITSLIQIHLCGPFYEAMWNNRYSHNVGTDGGSTWTRMHQSVGSRPSPRSHFASQLCFLPLLCCEDPPEPHGRCYRCHSSGPKQKLGLKVSHRAGKQQCQYTAQRPTWQIRTASLTHVISVRQEENERLVHSRNMIKNCSHIFDILKRL